MVVKVYISLCSGLKEVKKRQQKILMILDSKNIKYEILDISEPGKETDKEFMHANSTSNGATASDMEPRHPLPPQVFNDELYCGDFLQFELANEIDSLEVFLKLSDAEIPHLNKSTLDTSKMDENQPWEGKVIETEKPDDDKENKTEDVQNQEKDDATDEDKNVDLKKGNDEASEDIIDQEALLPDNYSVLAENMLENEGGHDGDENDESVLEVPIIDEVHKEELDKPDGEFAVEEDGEFGEDIVEEVQTQVTPSSDMKKEEITEKELDSENETPESDHEAPESEKLTTGEQEDQ